MTTLTATDTNVWTIDPTHSLAEFSVKHLMITTVKGRFGSVTGSVVLGPTPRVGATIDVSTIDTRTEQRDQHLRSADFFDVATYPLITFTSTRIEGRFSAPGDKFRIVGDLTIRNVTKEVILDAEFEGEAGDPWGGQRAAFSAVTKIDRRDFGLTWNQALETGGVVVSNEVKVSLEVQAVKA